jgi:hypothetical protein
MSYAIPITTNSFRNTGEPRHLWWNNMISHKTNTTLLPMICFFRKVFRDPLLLFRFPKVRPMVVQLWKNLAWLHVWKAKFSRFYICYNICIGSHRCRGHHVTLTVWLCDVVGTDFIWALHPNMRCVIPITTNSFHNMGGVRHLWWNYIISSKQTLLCCLW